jgi:pantoate--beta-alanine ligase
MVKAAMKEMIQKTDGIIDYISIADPVDFTELQVIKKGALISLSVRFGKTRLIDNIILK